MVERPPASPGQLNRRWDRLVIAVAAFGIGFQVLHLAEHAGQAAYWVGHSAEPPWMSPLGRWVHHRTMTFGLTTPEATEAMHLVGNALFLVGLGCLWGDACHRCAVLGGRRVGLLRKAWIVEAAHCCEHLALTASTLVTGRAIGLSTLFGLLGPGPFLWSYRVWWHLLANLAPVALIAAALLSPAARMTPPPPRSAPHDLARAFAAGRPRPDAGRGG
jgi:hypothetical protein